jgi:queuine/archaeosine tRNA-ribosyltransferase
MIDSGGFALSTNPNARWTLRHVSEAIDEIPADIFVALDRPPNPQDGAGDRMRKIQSSVRNYERLIARFPHKVIMPVIHGRTHREIEKSISLIAEVSPEPAWVGIGGMVPLLQKRRVLSGWRSSTESFIALVVSMTRDHFRQSRVHVFGAGGTRTFPAMVALGADSADSIGWRQAAGFGSVFLPLKSQRTFKSGTDTAPRKVLGADDALDIKNCHCPICRTRITSIGRVQLLMKSFHNRSIHNAWVVANQFKYWPKTQADLFSMAACGKLGSEWAEALKSLDRLKRSI